MFHYYGLSGSLGWVKLMLDLLASFINTDSP